MIWLSIIALALMQGITEFLPVSSSGHLAIMSALFGIDPEKGLMFSIALHAGSLLAIVVFYIKTLLVFFKKDQLHLLGMVIISTIPAGIAGVLLKKSGFAEALFGDLLSIGFALVLTGAILRLTGKPKLTANATTELKDITLRQALTVGFAQMFAIAPGISHSGATISAGILSGIKFEAAATFSFLLALPAIAGAALLEIIDIIKNGFSYNGLTPLQLGAGFVISAAASFATLGFLVTLIKRKKLSVFSYYVTIAGLAVIVWQLIKINRG